MYLSSTLNSTSAFHFYLNLKLDAISAPSAFRNQPLRISCPGCSTRSSENKASSNASSGICRKAHAGDFGKRLQSNDATINKATCKVKYKGKSYELTHAACYLSKKRMAR